ncbi:hypothetical protein [Streptomyces sp. R41]|uniref:Uncharacterized protein n=1 Tax=Streptomyces sp. R41 TaxID=3238632 RepID=A0AB39RYS4_9ACTN
MEQLTGIEEQVALVDAAARLIAERPVDVTDPNWQATMRQRPAPLDEAGVRDQAESALRSVIAVYEYGDEALRAAIRALFSRYTSFRWAAHLPVEATAEGLRMRVLHMSAVDQGADTRDELVALHCVCAQAQEAGIDIRPILREVAELSSRDDKYGMGSMRDILLRAAR